MAFRMEQDGHEFLLDAGPDWGGDDGGPRPKALLLSGLIGCTGMDVVSILRKMKVEGYGLRIEAEAGLTEEHPRVFSDIRVKYVFTGKNLPRDKVYHAVELSQDRYCGVSAMLAKTAGIEWEIEYRDEG
jgi:putative redox protein